MKTAAPESGHRPGEICLDGSDVRGRADGGNRMGPIGTSALLLLTTRNLIARSRTPLGGQRTLIT